MQARIKWVENMAFVAESGSGHAVVIEEEGGKTARIWELLAAMGTTAC